MSADRIRYDRIQKLESQVAKLKEEIETYINAESKEINQLKSTLDEIKTITSSVLFNKELEQIKSILAKHEDKK